MKKMLEICCGSYQDVVAAELGGADRVELNSALYLGGLTPSFASFKLAKENTDTPIVCMVRPRAAGFHYNKFEIESMFQDAEVFLQNKADGIAFGFLHEDRSIDIDLTTKMVELIHSYGKEAVFHRAFDLVDDQCSALEKLIACGVDRVLTSGGRVNCSLGIENLTQLQKQAQGRIELLMGSGVKVANIVHLMQQTGIHQAHSSAKAWLEDQTTTNQHLGYGYAGDYQYDVVDQKIVEELVKEIQ